MVSAVLKPMKHFEVTLTYEVLQDADSTALPMHILYVLFFQYKKNTFIF